MGGAAISATLSGKKVDLSMSVSPVECPALLESQRDQGFESMSVPVSAMRLTFQDGTELDIPSNLEFVGLDEEGFRVAYDAFLKTQAELGGLKGQSPPLNSKFWRERGPG